MSAAQDTFNRHFALAIAEKRFLGGIAMGVGHALAYLIGENTDRPCDVSFEELRTLTGWSRNTISKAVDQLVAAGIYIVRSGQKRRTRNSYWIRPLGPVCVDADPAHAMASFQQQHRPTKRFDHPLQGELDLGLAVQPGGREAPVTSSPGELASSGGEQSGDLDCSGGGRNIG
ncbi:MAG: hypothetical protein AAGI34_16450, partial [Pseudomonadota bacterium]